MAYEPDEKEKKYYHVQLEKPYFDKKTGARLSKPYVQKMTAQDYKRLVGKKGDKDKSNAEMLGYSVTVLWNPETGK